MIYSNERQISPELFIIGMPRSGTKLLRTILNNHSKIYIPDIEIVLIPRFIAKYGLGQLSKEDVQNVINELKRSIFFFYFLKKENFDFSCLKNGRNVREIISIMLHKMAGSSYEFDIYGDKSPGNIDHAELLFKSYPDALFIHIVRDPRDYALSVNNAWRKSKLRAATRWFYSISAFRSCALKCPDRVIEVRYEDLLDFPEDTIRKCIGFLGLEYERDMLILPGTVENLGDAKSSIIEYSNKKKYLSKMSPSCIRSIENYTFPVMDHYGYPHEASLSRPKKISFFYLKILSLCDIFNLIVFNFQEHGFVDGLRKILSARRSA